MKAYKLIILLLVNIKNYNAQQHEPRVMKAVLQEAQEFSYADEKTALKYFQIAANQTFDPKVQKEALDEAKKLEIELENQKNNKLLREADRYFSNACFYHEQIPLACYYELKKEFRNEYEQNSKNALKIYLCLLQKNLSHDIKREICNKVAKLYQMQGQSENAE